MIVLDFDGPLLDGRDRHYQCYRDILVEHAFQPVAIDVYWELKRNGSDRRHLLSLSDASSLYDEFLSKWMDRIETRHYLALDKLQPGVREILVRWKQCGIQLILVTMRNNPDGVHWQLEHFGIAPFLEVVLTTGTQYGGLGKAAAIEAILDVRAREELIWVGDTEVDFQASRQIGSKLCLVACGLRSRDYLASLAPDMLEENLEAFAHSEIIQRWSKSNKTANENS